MAEFVEFEVADVPRLEALERVIAAIAPAIGPQRSSMNSIPPLVPLLDPSTATRHRALPDGESELTVFVELMDDQEWWIEGVQRLGPDRARVDFQSLAGPWGGTYALERLIELFGHRATRVVSD